jgi:hypothetical protein
MSGMSAPRKFYFQRIRPTSQECSEFRRESAFRPPKFSDIIRLLTSVVAFLLCRPKQQVADYIIASEQQKTEESIFYSIFSSTTFRVFHIQLLVNSRLVIIFRLGRLLNPHFFFDTQTVSKSFRSIKSR